MHYFYTPHLMLGTPCNIFIPIPNTSKRKKKSHNGATPMNAPTHPILFASNRYASKKNVEIYIQTQVSSPTIWANNCHENFSLARKERVVQLSLRLLPIPRPSVIDWSFSDVKAIDCSQIPTLTRTTNHRP